MSRVLLTGLSDNPRWTVTCVEGHTTRRRQPLVPRSCPVCEADLLFKPFREVSGAFAYRGSTGRKRPSGEGALHTFGD